MNRIQNPANLLGDTPEHEQRIAAIRERAQRHWQRSARLFAHPPEVQGSDLPVPSLLAVACSVALANQAQAVEVGTDSGLRSALGSETHIELTQTISLTSESHIGFSGVSINGNGHTVELNKNRALWNGGYARNINNVSNITFKDGANLYGSGSNGGTIDLYGTGGITGAITNSYFLNSTANNIGGAIYANNIGGGIKDSHFEGNETILGHGGALYIRDDISGGIEGSTFENNEALSGYGGAIYAGAINGGISNKSTFKNNTSATGGAIYVSNGTQGVLNGGIDNSTFIGNTATNLGGGAIHLQNGILRGGISHSEFSDNTAQKAHGGALWLTTFEDGISDSQFIGNKALEGGGGVISTYTFDGGITNSTFEKNSANTSGGALYAYATFSGGIDNSTFEKNTAATSGGGAVHVDKTLSDGIKNNSQFIENTAKSHGGAVWVTDFTGGISDSKFIDNISQEGAGGALWVKNTIKGGITRSTFQNNTASGTGIDDGTGAPGGGTGGAIRTTIIEGGIDNSKFIGNTSTHSGGGAIHLKNGTLEGGITNSEFENNTAATQGGAIWTRNINGDISGTTFDSNKTEATGTGGAISLFETGGINGSIIDSTFSNNSSGDGGALRTYFITGDVSNTQFIGNTAHSVNLGGGAIHGNQIYGGIKNNSLFEKNISHGPHGGGAIFINEISDGIRNSKFIENEASVGLGGAINALISISGGISDSTFHKNQALSGGGAVAIGVNGIEGGINSSTFTENQAGGVGGAINAYKYEGGIHASQFINNTAGSRGGALDATTWINGGITSGSLFSGNTADSHGGAIYAVEGINDGISETTFEKNSSTTGHGGAISAGTLGSANGEIRGDINKSTFAGNHAEKDGGAIFANAITGNIIDSEFKNNTSTSADGGAIRTNTLTGNISGGTFSDNTADMSGGAIYADTINGNISSTFSDNSAGIHGGALYLKSTSGNNTIVNSTFSNNKAGDMGGAVYQETGGTLTVSDSRFLGNIAQASGGAIKTGGALFIKNSEFIANQGVDHTMTSATGLGVGLGGAVLIQGQLDIENSAFLGNTSAHRGAAIHHHHDLSGTTQAIRIAGGADKTLFYGNKETETGRYSSIEFSLTRNNITDVTIHADSGAEGNSGVLMLDAMQSIGGQGAPLNISKTGAGDWFLGGTSTLLADTNPTPHNLLINQGRLALTDVDYDGTGAQQAQINLINGRFSLANGAHLEGQGVISAGEINLSGTINPNIWRNTGMLAKDITTGITQSDIDGIQTVADKADSFATITLDTQGSSHAVKMDGATYEVGVAWADDGAGGFTAQSDLLDIKGKLEVTNNSGINITRLDFDQNWALARIQGGSSEPAAQVIKTTGGINGAFNVKVAGGLAPSSDFLKVRGEQIGNDYEVRLGLAWFSKERDGSKTAVSGDSVLDAHGSFTVDTGGSFTIGGALEKRTDVPNFINETTQAGGTAGWDGNSLTKRGGGTLILNGDNTYDGLTKIDGGTLVLGDSTASTGARVGGNVQINDGATFDGHGRAKGDVIVETGGSFTGFGGADGLLHVKNGGLLAPGNTTDMGTVDASRLQMDAGSTYRVKTDANGGVDWVNVANDATIHGGTVEVNAKDGNWGKRGTQHTRTIIQSGGALTGSFDNVTTDLAFLTPNLDYNNNQVILGLSRNSTKMEDIADGSTRNRINTAEGLGHLEGSGANPTLINELLGLNKEDALRAFDSLSGEIYPTTSTVLLQSSHQLRTRVNTRLTANTQGTRDVSSFNAIRALGLADTGTSTPVWVSAWGHTGNQGRTPNAARAEISGSGVLVGIDNTDRPMVGGLHAGMMFGSESTKVNIADGRNSRSEVESRSAGLYGGSAVGDTQWRGGLIYSGLDIETQRTVTVNNLTERVSAERKGKQMQAFAEISHNLTVSDRTSVAPWLNVAKVWQRLDPTTEGTSATALDIEKQSASATLTSVGGRGQVNLNEGRIPVALYADVGYQHVIDSKNNDSKHHFAGQTQDFAVRGTTLNDTLVSGVGLQVGVGRNSALLVEYRGEFGSGQKQHVGNISWQVKF